ncbi:MAG TPA: DUF2304 domain-containing protein [Methylomirabilota bacterium]|jgi:hypothetical protein|nr:DUF2304 domain-containing protein [Methylomirabilota bacterium]
MAELTLHQTLFALVTSLTAFLGVLELVRRRRLLEEYSWLWLLTAGLMVLLVTWYPLLLMITRVVGAVTPLNTLLLCAVLFLFAIAVHYSVIISRLSTQVKNLAQELALLSARTDDSPR